MKKAPHRSNVETRASLATCHLFLDTLARRESKRRDECTDPAATVDFDELHSDRTSAFADRRRSMKGHVRDGEFSDFAPTTPAHDKGSVSDMTDLSRQVLVRFHTQLPSEDPSRHSPPRTGT